MENRIFQKTVSFDRKYYGFDPENFLHFYFHFKPFSDFRRAKRERESELEERAQVAAQPSFGQPKIVPPPSLRSRSLTAQITHWPSFLFFIFYYFFSLSLSSSLTLLLPLRSPAMHQRGQVELRSWRPTTSCAPLGSPTQLSTIFLSTHGEFLPHLLTPPHRRLVKHLLYLCMNPIHHRHSSRSGTVSPSLSSPRWSSSSHLTFSL